MQFHYLDTINSLPSYLSFLFDDERITAFKIDTTTIVDNKPPEEIAFACHLAESMGGGDNTPTPILMKDASLKFAPTRIISLRTGITCNNSRFEKDVKFRKKNTIRSDNLNTEREDQGPVNDIHSFISQNSPNGYVQMNQLIEEISTLIGDKLVDVFDHIRELEGRKAFTQKEVEHQLLISLMTSDEGAEIFETNKPFTLKL